MSDVVFTLDDKRIQYLKRRDSKLSLVIDRIGPIKSYVPEDIFGFIVGEIVGQMLSNKVGDILEARLRKLCNNNISYQNILGLRSEEMRSIGLAYSKCEYLHNFATAVQNGSIVLDDLMTMDENEAFKKLTSIRGIGSWTAKMVLLFCLLREDVLPFEDGAFLQSYKWLYQTDDISRKSIEKTCSCWKPYSSIAARYMYRALDYGLTKKDVALFLREVK